MTSLRAAIMQEEDESSDDQQPAHPHNLSRLSMSSCPNSNDDDSCYGTAATTSVSRLSIESFDGDVDEEFSHDKQILSSDSDNGSSSYTSLPATPPRNRARAGAGAGGNVNNKLILGVQNKECASENEAWKGSGIIGKRMRKTNTRRRVIRERAGWDIINNNNNNEDDGCAGNCFSGESEGGGLMVITRPKGGRRSLCMDLEEVKACNDLGFELEHERMLEMPNSPSGSNSPIASWRISSPGDDPRDVKARLKIWAQAVALASSSSRT